jgi:divalent metal cation (Fe/Co/Zn/Cd) transporter
MSGYEMILRVSLLIVGFIITLVGAGMAWRTQREITPLSLIAAGVLLIVAATDGAK